MKYNNINQITENEIKKLIEEKVQEGTHLEYKREIKFSNDGDKKELLADVCSFSNFGGGTIIYGIEEEIDERQKICLLFKPVLDIQSRRQLKCMPRLSLS